ncbi:class I SAM-dependent RNA methyltransferase [Kocuria sp. HSID16901]|uniref:class I SAM-dependent RNA methyltransferase n=1 Tax=Kocuria sp. HSID16901 TaxID=2419505 RepID=UPI000F872DBF|nr:TRAM domain-containing protein [Kocuria sp. HSID16901]RUQ22731.1 class I SAM-dependent RNA methyltransferase [Kocuria sp. HSID16901]
MIEEGSEIEVDLDRMAHGGAAVGRHESLVCFVRDGLPGERVRARVESLGKGGRFANARAVEILNPSPDRRSYDWAPADPERTETPVGGVDYAHIRPEAQRQYKAGVIREQLERLGGMDPADGLLTDLTVQPLDAPSDEGWRTRVHWAVDDSGRLGMHPYHGSDIIPVEDLPFAIAGINALRLYEGEWRSIQRIDVAAPACGNPPLVVLTAVDGVVPEEIADDIDVELGMCLPTDEAVGAVILPAPRSGRSRGEKPAPVVVRGSGDVVEELSLPDGSSLRFRVGAGGFWQNHRAAPERLYDLVGQATGLAEGETAWDLYAGAGLLTAALADRVGGPGTVWAVEGSPVTAADAEFNFGPEGRARTPRAAQTQIVTTRAGVEQALARWGTPSREAHGGADPVRRNRPASRYSPEPSSIPDVVVLDPPRQGAGRKVLERLTQIGPRRIVYVSCDPAALGRDTGYLAAFGWKLAEVTGLDMYPDTHHVETLAVFERA